MDQPLIPLAERIRPKDFENFIGQSHLIGSNGPIRKAVANGAIPSMILWGPPGVGKTTLAEIIANELDRPFYSLSAISSGVKDIRNIIETVKNQGIFGKGNALLFIDEIHRFSKSQQDALLSAVEKGQITLIGATTENPSFEVIPALRSRTQIFILKSHNKDDLLKFIDLALLDTTIKNKNPIVKETDALIRISGGDARKLLNIFELVVGNEVTITVTNKLVLEKIQKNTVRYDKTGDQHYDIISAFIKSIRGSDPNGAVYWLARMIEGGEDLKFIARRLLIAASEDIGNANPTALILANNTFQAVAVIGYPESRIILSQCAVYLANSPKSNASYMAINKAQEIVKKTGDLPIPLHLRNAPTKLMKDLDYGKNYKYAHNYNGNFIDEEFLPEEISNTKIYDPGKNTREEKFREELKKMWGDKYDY